MKEVNDINQEERNQERSEDARIELSVFDLLGFGSIIILWGSLLILKEAGVFPQNVSTLPFAFLAFGIMLVIGGILKLHISKK